MTLITDSMAGHFMIRGEVDLVVVGADRIAANGDVANKIGTYTLAVLGARERHPVLRRRADLDHRPVAGRAAPRSRSRSARQDEVDRVAGRRIAPEGVRAAHPAFDVTPSALRHRDHHRARRRCARRIEPALRAAVAARRRGAAARTDERCPCSSVRTVPTSASSAARASTAAGGRRAGRGPDAVRPAQRHASPSARIERRAGGVPAAPRRRTTAIPPHAINYRANIWAMASARRDPDPRPERLRQPAAARQARRLRGLRPVRGPDLRPRADVLRRPAGRPHRRRRAVLPGAARSSPSTVGRELGITVHERGTVVVIQGPRFSTRAESRGFRGRAGKSST